MPRDNVTWNLHETPNPSERGFSMLVSQVEAKKFTSELDAFIAGSRMGDFPAIPEEDLKTIYGDYQYTMFKEADGPQGPSLRYFFGAPKTPTVANTPFRRTWKKQGDHRWPPILKGIVLLEDNSFPRSTNFISNGKQGIATGASFYDRYIYIPDTNEGTRFLLEEFQSAIPFIIPRYRTPVATAVQYSVNGLSGSFAECLHDEINIPATRTSSATYLGGAAFSGNGSLDGQDFPRTNFKTWLPYVLLDEQEQQETSGIWYRQRIRVYPPLLPRAIRR